MPIVGFLVGLLIISLGGGGGAVYVGILTVFFNIPPDIAASTSLATTIPTTAVGAFSHWKAGNVNLRFGLTMPIGGVTGSIAGSLCSGLLPPNLYCLSGGGSIVAGLMILGCPALETVGTSVLVLLGISVTGFAAHLGLDNIDWELVGLLAAGTMCGAFVGPFFLKRIDKKKLEKVLQPVLFLMTVVMGGILIFK